MDNAHIHEIDTTFGSLYIGGKTRNSKRNYAWGGIGPPVASYIVKNNPSHSFKMMLQFCTTPIAMNNIEISFLTYKVHIIYK